MLSKVVLFFVVVADPEGFSGLRVATVRVGQVRSEGDLSPLDGLASIARRGD